MKNKYKKISLLFVLFSIVYGIKGQDNTVKYDPIIDPAPNPAYGVSRDFIPVSPNAASLGTFGQIPVGYYTGTAKVSIPLYDLQYKELSVPIELSYHASGNKPEDFPGSVGMGWALQAGGCISRIVNGAIDVGPAQDGGGGPILLIDDFRYIEKWIDEWTLKQYLNGHTLTSHQGIEPDKYIFNINGQTGSFYCYRADTLRIQSSTGEYYDVKMHTAVVNNGEKPFKKITGFTMTDTKGVKYIFGGSGCIEYNTPGINFKNFETIDGLEYIMSPTSWMLKTIESPNNYNITFEYANSRMCQKTRFTDFGGLNGKPMKDASYFDNEKWNLVDGLVINKIITPASTVSFKSSLAIDGLIYPKKEEYNLDDFIYSYYSTILTPKELDDNVLYKAPQKIDNIVVLSNNEEIINYNLIYSYEFTKRMKLMGIDEMKNNETIRYYRYRMYYNEDKKLPDYLSGKTDHYGYYNNKEFFTEDVRNDITNLLKDFSTDNCVKLKNKLESAKAPDPYYADAEMLTKLVYPTGGYTTFEYEPHQYSCSFKTWPFRVENNSTGNKYTSGARIKRLCNYDQDNKLLQEKIYHYTKNYLSGNNLSSGVLAYTPEYIEFFENKHIVYGTWGSNETYDFFRVTSNPIYPLMPVKNHISYSEVTIEEPGNGFTVYKYKNFDNGYPDKRPFSYVSDILSDDKEGKSGIVEFWKKHPGISMDLERGQVLSKEVFDKDKKKKEKVIYSYNNTLTERNDSVRYLRHETNGFHLSGYKSYTLTTGVHYTYFPYLKRKQNISYFGADSILMDETFSYNNY